MSKLTVNAERGTYQTLPASSIFIGERCRKDFSKVGDLAESIDKFGLDNPVTVSGPDAATGKHRLIAGECRFRAMLVLGVADIPVIIRTDLSLSEQKELELEENLQRGKLAWEEQAEGERQLHYLLQERAEGTWGLEDTAEKIGSSRTAVARNIGMAEKIAARPELLATVGHLPFNAAVKRVEQIEQAERVVRETTGVALRSTMSRGDSRLLLAGLDAASVSLVLTDPPFGIEQIGLNRRHDLSGGSNAQQASLQETDNLSDAAVGALLRWLMPEIERVLKPSGHFYIFTCQQMWGRLREATLDAGLELQEYPLVWSKGRTTAPGRGYMYSPCSEPVLFGWKPPRKRMLEKNMAALLECKPIRGKRSIHPFQKPVELLKTLVSQSTLPGETVLDPFCGSASTLVAAVKLGRSAVGFDLDPANGTFPLARRRVEKAEAECQGVSSQDGKGGG